MAQLRPGKAKQINEINIKKCIETLSLLIYRVKIHINVPTYFTHFMFKKGFHIYIQIATNLSFMFLWGKCMKKSMT